MELKKSSKEELEMIAKIYEREFSKPPYNEQWKKGDALKK